MSWNICKYTLTVRLVFGSHVVDEVTAIAAAVLGLGDLALHRAGVRRAVLTVRVPAETTQLILQKKTVDINSLQPMVEQ